MAVSKDWAWLVSEEDKVIEGPRSWTDDWRSNQGEKTEHEPE
jgi:hypothetical protein